MRLAVNIDHIATIREARKTNEPDPVAAAMICELAGVPPEDRHKVFDWSTRLIAPCCARRRPVRARFGPPRRSARVEVGTEQGRAGSPAGAGRAAKH